MPQVANIAVSILFDGLAYAMFLFITSVGLSVTMGLMGFVNLAHGAFAMAGGYVVVTLTRSYGVGFVPSLIIAAIVVGAVSVVFERALYRRLLQVDRSRAGSVDDRSGLHGDRHRHLSLRAYPEIGRRCRIGCRARSISGFAISRATAHF